MRNLDPDIIGTDPRTAPPAFGLFADAAHSVEVSGTRSASRPVSRPEERTPLYPSADFIASMNAVAAKARAAMPGASQAAREAIAPHLSRLEAQTLAGIVAHGPITRDALAEVLAMNPNTLRPRVKTLLDRKLVHVVGYTSDSPRRELLAVAPTPEPETDR